MKNFLIPTLFFLFLLFQPHTNAESNFGNAHEFYVSICQIDHNPKTQALEITLKIFTDDLERALQTQQDTDKVYLGTPKESPQADQYIQHYLQKKLTFVVNNDTLDWSYVGKEVEFDASWCYIEIENVSSLHELRITNKILVELFDRQTNIVHLQAHGQKKSLLLHSDKLHAKMVVEQKK